MCFFTKVTLNGSSLYDKYGKKSMLLKIMPYPTKGLDNLLEVYDIISLKFVKDGKLTKLPDN